MSSYLIDKVEDIARRLKELEADQQLALTGSSAPVHIQYDAATGETLEYNGGYGEYAMGYRVRL